MSSHRVCGAPVSGVNSVMNPYQRFGASAALAFPACSLQPRETARCPELIDNRWINVKDCTAREPAHQQARKHKSRPELQQGNNNNQNNSNRAPFRQDSYGTLDSAYGTGESSYNTVDSTYIQQTDRAPPSDGAKGRAPKRRTNQKSDSSSLEPGPLPRDKFEQLKYVDDVNSGDDSDTATETETDTEQTFAYSGTSLDCNEMSYVPDYVRPMVGSPVSVSTVTTTTTSYTTSRPVLTSTRTSPATTTSSLSSPVTASKDFGEEATTPQALYKRADRSAASYAGYREDYVRKQKEKLCGRKSLDERLKSLESGASVKLEVCPGSQKRRKRSDATPGARKTDKFTFAAFSRPALQSEILKSDPEPFEPNVEEEQLDVAPSKPPQPDIIESHQPRPNATTPGGLESCEDSGTIETSKSDAVALDEELKPGDGAGAPKSLAPVFVKWNATGARNVDGNPLQRNGEGSEASSLQTVSGDDTKIVTENEDTSDLNLNDRELVEAVDSEPIESHAGRIRDIRDADANDVANDVTMVEENKSNSLHNDGSALRKLAWKKPSAETMNRLKDSTDNKKVDEKDDAKVVEQSEQPSKPETGVSETTQASSVHMRSQTRNPLQRSGAVPPLILDVTTDTAVVPVELRSPRGEGGAFPRPNMREKRNARVFALPSSDDSETDNLLARLNKHVEQQKPLHVAPVKFVPSVLRHRSRDRKTEDVSSSASSLNEAAQSTSPSKERKDARSATYSAAPRETSRRKSSRSPKRTKHGASRSRSSHERESHHSRDRSARSRRQEQVNASSDSLSSATVTSGEPVASKSSHHGSPDVRKRSSHKSDKPSSHRSSSRSKYNDEYDELSDAKGLSPKPRQVRDRPSLPSPRQQAVARAVKFGFPGDDGVIPYIDDTASPEEHKKRFHESRHRSADAVLANPEVVKRALPLKSGSRRGRSRRRSRSPKRRISYMEAMESSEDLTPDPDTDESYDVVRASSDNDNRLGQYGRCNSADSILSTAEPTGKVVLRKEKRSTSADRESLKGVYRRSYQIATSPGASHPPDVDLLRTPHHKRQPSIRKLKNFFGESTPQIVEAQGVEGRRGSRASALKPVATLDLEDYDDTVIREGFLSFKVATIEKGKRTSSQKLWKLVWVVLKEQNIYLCKDWTRNKQDMPSNGQATATANSSGSQTPSQLILEEEEPLNIQGSLVSIAYNYVKRKNVFKVTTGNGSEYLFQAEDRDDMLAWINSIQVSGNHDNQDGKVIINEDLILRKTSQIESGSSFLFLPSPKLVRKLSPKLEKRGTRKSRSPKTVRRAQVPVKDIDGSRRFKWRGSVNRIVRKFGQGQTLMQGQTFDVHLEDCPPSPNNEFIPFVVELCCRVVEERGLSFTGIYRVPGNSGTLAALQEELNTKGPDGADIENDERFHELNVVSSLLKSFFRKLPDPLFTNELYDDFITMNRKKDPEERLNGLRRLIHMLPAPHYETLKYLVGHLRKVADNAEVNKMEVRNLAIVFGPTLVRSTICDNMATMVTDMSDQCRIVESVLQHAVWFFAESKSDGSAANAPLPAPEDDHHEPVPNIDHLLANVGRTPGDESDSTESSKSKNSLASEKESFSRDVFDKLLGVRKRWLQMQQNGANATKPDGDEESDDEYGFKEAERRQARATEVRTQEEEEDATEADPAQANRYQVAKPAAAGIRASHAAKEPLPHLPQDIPARLYEFYVEQVERLARTEINRPPVQFTSSSDTSPQVTPRHSFFAVQPTGHRPALSRGFYDAKTCDPLAHHDAVARQNSAPASPSYPSRVPAPAPALLYGESSENRRFNKNTEAGIVYPFFTTSTPMHPPSEPTTAPLKPSSDNSSEVTSISKTEPDPPESESDSDTSIYVGDTLEEKLKNLTNLDKKLPRRPSRRYTSRPQNDFELVWDRKPSHGLGQPRLKRLTAPSHRAGELAAPESAQLPGGKKSSHEIYLERRAARQQHRELSKANRSNRTAALAANNRMSRCASDENIFKRSDPKRQKVRQQQQQAAARDDAPQRRPSGDRVRRRHTLGGNDFPRWELGDEIGARPIGPNDGLSGSLQNIPRSAVSRLKPRVPGPNLTGKYAAPSGRQNDPRRTDLPKTREMQLHKEAAAVKKTESYI